MFYLPFLPPAYSCELVTMGEERGSTVIFGNLFTRTDVILNVLLTRHSFFKSVMCTSIQHKLSSILDLKHLIMTLKLTADSAISSEIIQQ